MNWLVTTIISGINIIFILSLVYVYLTNFLKIKSKFTFGLLLFIILFLFHNALVFYFSFTMMPLYADGISQYMFIFTVLQTLGFAVLAWVTWK